MVVDKASKVAKICGLSLSEFVEELFLKEKAKGLLKTV
jgi:hypothetical protein